MGGGGGRGRFTKDFLQSWGGWEKGDKIVTHGVERGKKFKKKKKTQKRKMLLFI